MSKETEAGCGAVVAPVEPSVRPAAEGHNGMDLLDYMATKAMQGMLAGHFACYGHDNYWKRDDIAEEAYEMAEAMMAEREKRARSHEPQSAVAAAFGGLVQTAQG